jgi:hypothetical protein
MNFFGESGEDVLRINAGDAVDVEAGADLRFHHNGGDGDDQFLLQHGGRVNGVVNGRIDGGSGNDVNVRATELLQPGSTPTRDKVVWEVNGDDGDDRLTLQVHRCGHVLDGQRTHRRRPGFNICSSTPNVSTVNCQ